MGYNRSMGASMWALLPLLLLSVAWGGLPGRVLANTGARTGTPCVHSPSSSVLRGGDALPCPLHDRAADMPLGSVPRSMLSKHLSLFVAAAQAMPSCCPVGGCIRLKYGGICRGDQKLGRVDTAFGEIAGAPPVPVQVGG